MYKSFLIVSILVLGCFSWTARAEDKTPSDPAPPAPPATLATPATISATAPTDDEVIAAVKKKWERAANGINEAQSVEIKSVKVSKTSRPWANPSDVGSPGYQIWAAKVDFLLRTHYNARTVVYEWDYYFDFSANSFGEWILQTSGQGDSKTTKLPDEPASKPLEAKKKADDPAPKE